MAMQREGRNPMSNESVIVLEEPPLEFAHGQLAQDPHDGLGLFGPHSLGMAAHPQSPAYIVLGTPTGLEAWAAWSARINRPAAAEKQIKHTLWPPFPGFEVAFGSPWSPKPVKAYDLNTSKLLDASRLKDPHERCFAVVEQFLSPIEASKKLDVKPSVAICIVPDEVYQNCRPESRVVDPIGFGIGKKEKLSRKRGQQGLFETYNTDQYNLSPDFRRQLKARSMGHEIPVQIVRESTLKLSDEFKRGERGLTPLSDRLWNLSTALYYKSGGRPWKLRTAREGVCYIGIAFRKSDERGTACCAAQMFLDSGDGIVFLGEYGPWWSPEDKEFHLTKDAARKLLSGVLATYAQQDGRPLAEVFLHCRSFLNREEIEGFKEACPQGCKIVGVRVREDKFGPRLFRIGQMPVLRGTFWKLNGHAGYLFGTGFKPRLATYDGWEVPVPMRIDIQFGDGDIESVARDIFGLTKLNYNTCKLGDSQPVTVGFSDAVGEILVSNPTVTNIRANFKYYI